MCYDLSNHTTCIILGYVFRNFSLSDGENSVDQILTVNVLDTNDETPVITVGAQMSIHEELPVGTGVARGYDVSDKDAGDTLTYTLSGKGDRCKSGGIDATQGDRCKSGNQNMTLV